MGIPHYHTREDRKAKWIARCRNIHGGRYWYGNVVFTNAKSNVSIICGIHGEFMQRPDHHAKGSGCSRCGDSRASRSMAHTRDVFIAKALKVHEGLYDYGDVIYERSHLPVSIICKTHGNFSQAPASHLQGTGCPTCCSSRGESEVSKWLSSRDIEFKTQHTFSRCRHKQILHFDFYLPTRNTCIEYDGRQHFEPVSQFGGMKGFEEVKIRDSIKHSYCVKERIRLIRIKYTENVDDVLSDHLGCQS